MDFPANPLDLVLVGWVVLPNTNTNRDSLLQAYKKRSKQSSLIAVRANARLLSNRSPLRLHQHSNNSTLPLQTLKISLTHNSKPVLGLIHGDGPTEAPVLTLWRDLMPYVVLEIQCGNIKI